MRNRNFKSSERGVSILRIKESRLFNLFRLASLFTLLFFGSQLLYSQTSNADFERIKIAEGEILFSGLTLSPDGSTMAISTKRPNTVKLVDWKTRKLIHEYPVRQSTFGSKISFSHEGKLLLLKGLKPMEISENKVRNIDFEIVSASTGKQIKLFENVQDAVISNDEKWAVTLSNDEIVFWNLAADSKGKSFNATAASNAIALSPDGKILAVSEKVNPENINSRFKKDKKGFKAALKYKQMVTLYDVPSGSKIKTINELYDIIYDLSFSPEGESLLVYQTPDIRIQANNNKQSFINLIDMANQEPMRKGFTSMSLAQPELKFSNNQKLFAINSKGSRFQEIHLYDSGSGTLQKRFELGSRFFERVEGEKLTSDSRPSFTFLPGDQSILIAMGNQLVIWNLENNP